MAKGPSRNAPCPCGSGRKYKLCCLPADEARAREARLAAQPPPLIVFPDLGDEDDADDLVDTWPLHPFVRTAEDEAADDLWDAFEAAEYDQQISLGPITVVGSGADLVNTVNGNDPRVRAAAQNLVDASISTLFDTSGSGKVRATIYGRNLTNDLGTAAAFTVAGLWSFASPREPRTYGVTLGYEF